MLLEGQTEALAHLFENEQAIRAGEAPPHRILLIGTGGGMSCIRTAAYLSAWRDVGIERAVDHAITVSGSGGGVGAYLSGMPHRAMRIFETLAVSGFISRRKNGAQAMRLEKLGQALRGAHCPIAFDDKRIKAHRTTWHVVATRLSGESLLIDAKEAMPDTAQAVLASSAFPSLTVPVRLAVEGAMHDLVDGACGMPLPIGPGIKRFRPDTVIVLESLPHPKFLPWLRRQLWPWVAPWFLPETPQLLRGGVARMDTLLARQSDRLARLRRIRWCRVTPSPASVAVGPLTTDARLLRKAADEARRFMESTLRSAAHGRMV